MIDRINILLILICFFAIFSSCSTNNTDETKRTYPEALDFKLTSVKKLKTNITPPDSLNTNVYVLTVISCPKNASCILPDGIVIADTPDEENADNTINLNVRHPLQFMEGEQYRLSLDLSTYPGNGKKRFQLLGYTRLN